MHPFPILQMLALLAVANTTPLLAKRVLGARFSRPIDLGRKFRDGRPLLGPSKTIRGLVLAIGATAGVAPLVGLGVRVGLLVGAGAMLGDLLASFVKRRCRIPSSGRSTGLDQVPESLLPLLICRTTLGLTGTDILLTVAVFLVGEMVFARLFFRWQLRDRPY